MGGAETRAVCQDQCKIHLLGLLVPRKNPVPVFPGILIQIMGDQQTRRSQAIGNLLSKNSVKVHLGLKEKKQRHQGRRQDQV
jgi:hypothetical protein